MNPPLLSQKCGQCHSLNSPSHNYCEFCGSLLRLPCPFCAKPTSAGDSHCHHCQAILRDTGVEPTAPGPGIHFGPEVEQRRAIETSFAMGQFRAGLPAPQAPAPLLPLDRLNPFQSRLVNELSLVGVELQGVRVGSPTPFGPFLGMIADGHLKIHGKAEFLGILLDEEPRFLAHMIARQVPLGFQDLLNTGVSISQWPGGAPPMLGTLLENILAWWPLGRLSLYLNALLETRDLALCLSLFIKESLFATYPQERIKKILFDFFNKNRDLSKGGLDWADGELRWALSLFFHFSENWSLNLPLGRFSEEGAPKPAAGKGLDFRPLTMSSQEPTRGGESFSPAPPSPLELLIYSMDSGQFRHLGRDGVGLDRNLKPWPYRRYFPVEFQKIHPQMVASDTTLFALLGEKNRFAAIPWGASGNEFRDIISGEGVLKLERIQLFGGKIYLLDPIAKTLHLFTLDGVRLSGLDFPLPLKRALHLPVFLCPGRRQLVISDRAGNKLFFIHRFTGEIFAESGGFGNGPGELDEPGALAIHQGWIVVHDRGNDRCQCFNFDGSFQGPCELFPGSGIVEMVSLGGDYLAVLYRVGRVGILTPGGQFHLIPMEDGFVPSTLVPLERVVA